MYLEDGLSGTAQVNETTETSALLASPSATTSVEGSGGTNEVQAIAQYAVNPVGGTFTLSFTTTGDTPFTTAAIAYNAVAATVQTAVDTAAVGNIAGYVAGDIAVTGGPLTTAPLTLTFSGNPSVDLENHSQTTINGALLLNGTLSGQTTLAIDTVVLNTDDTDQMPVGARFTLAGEVGVSLPIHTVTARVGNPTTSITFTPALVNFVGNGLNTVLTILNQQIEIRIGDGDLSWTESREILYDLDRDILDDVRLGPEQPIEVNAAFVFEWASTGTGEPISPIDAIKRINEAAEWVSSDSDQCRPYSVDIVADHIVPCGTNQDQRFTFEDFRWESLEYSIQDAAITLSGRCNRTDALVERLDIT
jgi:hypothetical protein